MEDLKVFKCKTCGEALDIRTAKDGVIECKVCSTVHTLPKKGTAPEALMFLKMGEHDLDTCNWEDAMEAFKKAFEKTKNEPEAYWGLALANYKVQYIKDVVNNRLQPICYEISERKFTESRNYQLALKFATPAQRKQYEKKAEEIEYIKEEFYKLKKSGLNFDCFICVKVSDEKDGKTEDYKDAEYIYDLLKNKGYTPFFSERSIRNRTGADYEAMILYALHTAETMLVVCHNEDYLQTPWVKNEYTRFLRLVNDEEKESDAITFVYKGKPIDRLPGRGGKLQGIDFSSRDADGKIIDFVEKHTPQAKARREAAKRKRAAQAQEQAKRFKEMQDYFERRKAEEEERERKAAEEALRKAEEEARIKAAEAEEQAKRLAQMQAQLEEQRKMFEKMEAERREAERREAERREAERSEKEQSVTLQPASHSSGSFDDYLDRGSDAISESITKIGDAIHNATASAGNAVSQIASSVRNAFGGASSLTINDSTWQIENGVVKKYRGRGGEVTIPNGAKSIGERAFCNCANLISVTIPNGVTKIGNRAFEDCADLISITIPVSVKSIGSRAFLGCNGLKSVYYMGSIAGWCVMDFKNPTANPLGYVQDLYVNNRLVTDLVIPKGLTRVADYVFYGYKRLKSIQIPDSVTAIGECAFYGCGLTGLTIPNSVISVGDGAFESCFRLKSVVMPRALRERCRAIFKDYFGAFSGCKFIYR